MIRNRSRNCNAWSAIVAAVLATVLAAAVASFATAQAPPVPPAPIPPGSIPDVPIGNPGPPAPPSTRFEPGPAPLAPAPVAPGDTPAQKFQAKSKARPPAVAKPAPRANGAPKGDPWETTSPATGQDGDMAYGAFQRGYYLTAFAFATDRVDQIGDVKAMTLLGELYANGFGVIQDDVKAAEWYRIAAERGDREAMFALAMFRIGGRGGPANRDEAARLLAQAAKLRH